MNFTCEPPTSIARVVLPRCSLANFLRHQFASCAVVGRAQAVADTLPTYRGKPHRSFVLHPTPFCSQRTNRNRANQREPILNNMFASCLRRTDAAEKLQPLPRHCEPTGRANARPMTGSATYAPPRKNHLSGKSAKTCPVPRAKIFRFRSHPNHRHNSARLARMRGARERHERAVRCDGRGRRRRRARLMRTAKSCGSGAAVLALSP